MLWELDQTEEVLRWYREFIPQAPDELTGFFATLTVPPGPPFPEHLHNRKMCGVVWSYCGGPRKAVQVLKAARSFLKPALDLVGPMPYPVLQSMFDPLLPPGLQWYWKAHFLKEIPDASLSVHRRFGEQMPTPLTTMHLYPIDGAARRVGKDETAWPNRDAVWAQVIVGIDPDPANKDALTQWARSYWNEMEPFSMAGAYVSAAFAVVTQRAGEFGGPTRLWRVPLGGGKRQYASLPSFTAWAVPFGPTRVIAYGCDEDDKCSLVQRDVTYRTP